jgi:hypothetical protein
VHHISNEFNVKVASCTEHRHQGTSAASTDAFDIPELEFLKGADEPKQLCSSARENNIFEIDWKD